MEENLSEIKIKSMDGTSFAVNIALSDTVLSLKNLIHSLRELEVERQRIIYRGRVLRDNDTLSGHGLEEGHTIHLVPRPVGVPPSPMVRAQQPPSIPQSSPVMTGQQGMSGMSGLQMGAGGGLGALLGGIMGSDMGRMGGGGGGGGSGSGSGLSNNLQAALASAMGGARSRNRDHPLSEGIPEGRQLEHLHQAILTMNTLVSTMPLEETVARDMVQQAQHRRQLYPSEFFENTDAIVAAEGKNGDTAAAVERTRTRTRSGESKSSSANGSESNAPPALLRTGSAGLEEDLLLSTVADAQHYEGNNTGSSIEDQSNSTTDGEINSSASRPPRCPRPRLYNGQWLDVKDTVNQWLEATVLGVSTDGKRVQVHYNGWPSRWDEWIDADSNRIAPFRTKTVHSSATPHTSPSPIAYTHSSTAPVVGVNDIRYVLPRVDALIHSVLPLFDRVVEMGVDQRRYEKRERVSSSSSSSLSPSNAQEEWERRDELRTHAEYLAPLMDRLGRLMSDLAPHIATIADQPYHEDSRAAHASSTTTNTTSTTNTTTNTPVTTAAPPGTPTTTPTSPLQSSSSSSSSSSSNGGSENDIHGAVVPPPESMGSLQRSPIVGPAASTPQPLPPPSATTLSSQTTSPYRRLVATPVATGISRRNNIDIHIHAVMPMNGGGGGGGGAQQDQGMAAQLAALAANNGAPRHNMHQEIMSAGGLESFLSNVRTGGQQQPQQEQQNTNTNTNSNTSSTIGQAPPQPLSTGRNIPAEIRAAGGLEQFLGVSGDGRGVTSVETSTTETTISSSGGESPSRSLRSSGQQSGDSDGISGGNTGGISGGTPTEGLSMLFNLLQQSGASIETSGVGSSSSSTRTIAQGVQRRREQRQRILQQRSSVPSPSSSASASASSSSSSVLPGSVWNTGTSRSPSRSPRRSPSRSSSSHRLPARSPSGRLRDGRHPNAMRSESPRTSSSSPSHPRSILRPQDAFQQVGEVEEVRNMFLGSTTADTTMNATSGIRRSSERRRMRMARSVFTDDDNVTAAASTNARPPRGARDLLGGNNPSGVMIPMFDNSMSVPISDRTSSPMENVSSGTSSSVSSSLGTIENEILGALDATESTNGCSTQIS